MILRRPALLLACLLSVAAGLAWFVTDTPTGHIPTGQLAVEQPYSLDVAFERSRLDLPFDAECRYLLIVGSLSDEGEPRQITLTAEPIEQAEALSGRELLPLDAHRNGSTENSPSAASRQTRGRRRTDPQGVPKSQASSARDPARPENGVSATTTRDFYLHVTDGALDDARQYARVIGRPVGEGRLVRVYLDSRQRPDELSAGLVEETIRLLDDELLPSLQRQVSECRDVDGDGKFSVLFSPWLGRLQGGRTSLGGFVRGSDFRGDVDPPFSNHSDMMYLNTNLQPGPHLRTLLAHELMHAVCFSARMPSPTRPNGLPEEEDWLNEAIAHLSENLNGGGWSNLDYRISRFLDEPQRFPLVVEDYYDAGLWRNHGCRGATYLFLRWCVDQYGVELLEKLIHSPERGRENLRRATGVEFEELFRRWTVALYLSGLRSPAVGSPSPDETASDEADLYHSLDLRGPLSNWGLAGPRTIDWDVNAGPYSVGLAGTSAAFIVMRSPQAAGMRRIRITGRFGTKLQVTLLKLPADCPDIDGRTEWTDADSPSQVSKATSADHRLLRVQIGGSEKSPLVVELLACERNRGEAKESFCFAGKRLADCRESPGAEPASAREQRQARAPRTPACYVIPLPLSADAAAGEWRVKVVARNTEGRRVCRWVDLSAAGGAAARLRVARATSTGERKNDER